MTTKDPRGEWMMTFSAKKIYPASLRAEDICLIDIAHALSRVCRFGGHSSEHYCPTLEQRVLKADLNWVPAGDLRHGDELLGFDEYLWQPGSTGKNKRRFRHATVLAESVVRRQCYLLEMSDGSTVRCSAEHPWLVATKNSGNQKWMTTLEIVNSILDGRKRYMHKLVAPWKFEGSRDAGWLAGIYDGEGYLSADRTGTILGVAQNPGLVLDEMIRSMKSFGFDFGATKNDEARSKVITLQMRGGWREIVRLLGSIRPIRLVNKFQDFLRNGYFDKQLNSIGEPSEIVKFYNEGTQDCAALETSTRTFICEGFGAHNSVAQHAVLVSRVVESLGGSPEEVFYGLHHDDSEAYLGDVVWPLKQSPAMSGYRVIERIAELAIAQAFGLATAMPGIVKHADLVLLATEKRDIMGGEEPALDRQVQVASLGAWHCDAIEPMVERIVPLEAKEAKALYLERHQELEARFGHNR